MALGYNNVTLLGYVKTDPEEVTYEKDEKEYTFVKYEVNVPKNAGKGYNFFICYCYGKNAQYTLDHFKKGMQVFVSGEVITAMWRTKGGITNYSSHVNVYKHLLTKFDGNAPTELDTSETLKEAVDIELPFEI